MKRSVVVGFLLLICGPVSATGSKVLIQQLDVDVQDMLLMFTVDRPDDQKLVVTNIRDALARHLRDKAGMVAIDMPTLGLNEKARFVEHQELFEMVARSVFGTLGRRGSIQDFPDKVKSFDYSLGPGLEFLREKTGAEYILFYGGHMYFPVSDSTVAYNWLRQSDLAAVELGMVELASGRIVWMNSAKDDADLRDSADVDALLQEAFAVYPHSRHYQAIAGTEVSE